MFRLSRIPDRIGIWKRWFPIVRKFITWRKIHTAGPGSDNIVSHGKVNIRNRTQSVIIEARTTNEQTPYHLPTTPAPLPPYPSSPHHPHELKLLSRFMEAGIMGFWNRNSSFTNKRISGIKYLESGIHNVESTILNSLGSIVETRVIAMF